MHKKLVSALYLKHGKAVTSFQDAEPYKGGDAVELASHYSNLGADLLLVFDLSESGADAAADARHDESLTLEREIVRRVDVPVWGLGNIKRVEDVKKILYTGARKAVLNFSKASNMEMLEEVSKRFGKDKIGVCIDTRRGESLDEESRKSISAYASVLVVLADATVCGSGRLDAPDLQGLSKVVVVETAAGSQAAAAGTETSAAAQDGAAGTVKDACAGVAQDGAAGTGTDACAGVAQATAAGTGKTEISNIPQLPPEDRLRLLLRDDVEGLCEESLRDPSTDIMQLKADLRSKGADLNFFECSVGWDDLKKDDKGLVPCVVQDYKNEQVLMVAYMNRESFEKTVRTGVMTYWSRSRKELWIKGETSGHYQYVRELLIDCDNDTLLAKVLQIGAACHTGNRSCFYRTVLKKDYVDRSPMKVLEQVYGVITDRKAHPKEGSYTNYLFDKGIDKILKKCGEEATEIVIAAKNPNPEEVRYEMADFLYHMMVLMAERGLTWEDIAEELANRE